MVLNKYLFLVLIFMINGCGSDSENVIVDEFDLKTTNETDFLVMEYGVDSRHFKYTKDNGFHFDSEGYLVNKLGDYIVAFPVDASGNSLSTSITTTKHIKIDYEDGQPKATDRVALQMNLPRDAPEVLPSEFNEQDSTTFSNASSISIFDSMGDTNTLTIYFLHINKESNTWAFRWSVNGNVVQDNQDRIIDFLPNGMLDVSDSDNDGVVSENRGILEYLNIPLDNGANDLSIKLDLSSGTTSHDSTFEVLDIDVNGFHADNLKALTIESDGLVKLTYGKGSIELLGRIALAKFPSPQHLEIVSESLWKETEASGTAYFGEAGSQNFGEIVSITYNF